MFINGSDVVTRLSRELGDGPFGTLMDQGNIEGGAIVSSLAKNLKSKARVRTDRREYITESFVGPEFDYPSEVKVSLNTETTRQRRAASLAMSALYETNFGTITKRYSYDVVMMMRDRNTQLHGKGQGRIRLSSEDAVPEELLATLAENDQLNHDPIEALRHGAEMLRSALLRSRQKIA